jgi:hypothetical protein
MGTAGSWGSGGSVGTGGGDLGTGGTPGSGGSVGTGGGDPGTGGTPGSGGSVGTGGGGNPADVELVFWSDWRTATGTSSNALLDGGEWSGQSYSSGTQVVSASGLGFPASMRNVFRTPDNGFDGGDASLCNGSPLPAVGEAVTFRLYVRHDLKNPGGDISNASNHNIQPGVGNISYAWSWKWGLRANDDIDNIQLTALNDNVYMHGLGGEYPPGTVLILEWSFERVTGSTWRARAKLSDVNYRTLGTADTVSAPITDLDVPLQNSPCGSSAPARSLFVGWSGGAGWQNVTGYNYFGGVAVAITTPGEWIGPYPTGPEAN